MSSTSKSDYVSDSSGRRPDIYMEKQGDDRVVAWDGAYVLEESWTKLSRSGRARTIGIWWFLSLKCVGCMLLLQLGSLLTAWTSHIGLMATPIWQTLWNIWIKCHHCFQYHCHCLIQGCFHYILPTRCVVVSCGLWPHGHLDSWTNQTLTLGFLCWG